MGSKKSGNKHPTQFRISYPSVFKPLLDKEFEEKGYYSYTVLMGDILAEHFKERKPKADKEKIPVKGVIQGEKDS